MAGSDADSVVPAASQPGTSEAVPGLELSPYDRDIVIRTVLGEASNQGDEGQAAVANVIKNRHKAGFADSASGVALAPYQFEPWLHSGNIAYTAKAEDPAYQRAGSIVDNVYSDKYADNTNGATHFYAPVAQRQLGRNDPSWAYTYTPTAQIGGHNFYQDPKFSAVLSGDAKAAPLPSSSGTVGDLARAITSPVRRVFGMDDTQAQPSQWNSGNVAYPNQFNNDLAKALIGDALGKSEYQGKGNMLGKIAMLFAGNKVGTDNVKAQRDYMLSNPALQPSGVPQSGAAPTQPAAATGQPDLITRLVHALTGTQPQTAQPIRPRISPPPAFAPIAGPQTLSPITPPQSPGNGPTEPVPVPGTPTPPAPQMPPAASAIPSPQPPTAQPSFASQGEMLIPPSADPKQARSKIEEQFPDAQIQWNLRNPDPAVRSKGMEMAQAKRTALAGIDQPDTEPKQITLPNGQTAYGVGNRFSGYRDNGQPRIDPAKLAGDKRNAEEVGVVYGKKLGSIQQNANTSMNELPQLQLLQKVMNDPSYISGTGASTLGRLSSAARTMGLGSGETASLMQFASKLGKAGALENIEELGTQGAVRVPTLNLIAQSNYDEHNTPEANRAVVEIRSRTAQRTIEVADMASEYAQKHGHLDPTFDREVRDHFKDKPLFTPDEVKDFGTLLSGKKPEAAPPAAKLAPNFTKEDVEAEMRRRGLVK